MVNLMRIQGPQSVGGLDFSPISQALDFGQKARSQNAMLDLQQQQVGQGQQRLDILKQNAAQQREQVLGAKFAGLAQYIQGAPEDQRAALWQKVVGAHPSIAQGLQKYQIDPADWNAGTNFFIAQARGYQDPLKRDLTRSQIEQARASAAASRAKTAAAAGAVGLYKTPKDRIDTETKVRKEFSGLSGEFVKIRDAYARIQSSDDSGAGDLSLIFNYMKMLDPGSVVREGEFANAENAGGIGERVRNLYNKIISGERLSPHMRGQFKTQASRLYTTADKQFQTLRQRYSAIAKRYGLDPDSVAQNFGASSQPQAPVAVPGTVVDGGNDPLGIR